MQCITLLFIHLLLIVFVGKSFNRKIEIAGLLKVEIEGLLKGYLVLLTYGCLVRLLLKRGLREVRERPKKKHTEDKPG